MALFPMLIATGVGIIARIPRQARRTCGYCLGCGVNLPLRGCPNCGGTTGFDDTAGISPARRAL